jgi:hypothetical protein
MNRVRDYCTFAIGYCGLGYILVWPLSSPDGGSALFGAAFVCGGRMVAPVRWLCDLPHPLQFSVPLHLLGLISALAVAARLALWLLRRIRRPASLPSAPAASASGPAPALADRPRLRRPSPIKPRAHFGLRGTPP